MATKTEKTMGKGRYDELNQILEWRRLEIIGEVQHKIRTVRKEGAAVTGQDVRDEAESSEAEIQDDIEFALLQIKTETLAKITEALSRLQAGAYGYCYDCGEEIAEQRLRVLPFAVRCKGCEEELESEQNKERVVVGRLGAGSLFADMIS